MEYINSYRDSLTADILPGYDDSLYHHGIKGMKWGVRRYQNPDGSLKAAGRRHRREIGGRKRGGLSDRQKELIGRGLATAGMAGAAYLMYKNRSKLPFGKHESFDDEIDNSGPVIIDKKTGEPVLDDDIKDAIIEKHTTEQGKKTLDDMLDKHHDVIMADIEAHEQERDGEIAREVARRRRQEERRKKYQALDSDISYHQRLVKKEMEKISNEERKAIVDKYSGKEQREIVEDSHILGRLKKRQIERSVTPRERDGLSTDDLLNREREARKINKEYLDFFNETLLKYGPEKFRDCAILAEIRPMSLSSYGRIIKLLNGDLNLGDDE